MQKIGVGLLLLFAWSQSLYGIGNKAKSNCLHSLSGELRKHIKIRRSSVEPVFSTLINKERAELLADYYRRTSKKEIYLAGMRILRDLLSDSEHLVAAEKRIPFLYSVKHFVERGGRFVIDMDMSNFDTEISIITLRDPAYEYIHIPIYKLLSIEIGVQGAKENLLYDLAHELRHSITDNRTRQALIRSGIRKNPEFIYEHMDALGSENMSQSIAYAYQLEREAVVAQAQFVPQASKNNGDANFYPQLQSLQRMLNDIPHKDLRNLHRKLRNKKHFRILIESYADSYISFLENSQPELSVAPSLAVLLKKLEVTDLNRESALKLALSAYDDYKFVIRGRLSDELDAYLKSCLGAAFKRKELRLLRAYRSLQSTHNELREPY